LYRWLPDSHKAVYTISIAAELLGCHPRTLRIYEQVGLIQPKRTGKRYRLYSQHDLTMIKKLCALMHSRRLTLAGVKAMLDMAERFEIQVEKMLDEMSG
jgi:MerR family transcriptional regulator/heat shock protein HspR